MPSYVIGETVIVIALHEWNMQVAQGNTNGEMTALTPDGNSIILILGSITV